MELEGDYTFDAPRELVWEAVRDPDVLGSVLPGGEGIAEIGENEYEGQLKMKVGPVQGTFQGNIKLSNIVAPESYDIEIDGKGAPGFVKANGSLKLIPQGEQTVLNYSGKARIGGRIASVGQRLLDASAKSIVRQSLEALNEYLRVQMARQQVVAAATEAGETAEDAAQAAAALEVPEYKPPSQTELAVNVARDVAGDLIPAQYRPVVIGVIVVVVLLLAYFIFF